MKAIVLLKSIAVGLAVLALAPAVSAQTRTWVSGVGNDANPCSRTAPCKTFAGAISHTATGGIIDVLDPGGFGALTITKSITIDGSNGSIAGVLAAGTNAININCVGCNVILRNLDIEGIGTGLVGVSVTNAASVTIEHCNIFGFTAGTGAGILVSLGSSAKLVIKDTVIRDNLVGIRMQTTAGAITATLDSVTLENNSTFGAQAAGNMPVTMTVRRSTINNNPGTGIHAAGPSSLINLVNNSVSLNGAGVNAAFAGSRIRLSGNTIVNNPTGLAITAGAVIESDGTNRISGSGATVPPNGTFTVQ